MEHNGQNNGHQRCPGFSPQTYACINSLPYKAKGVLQKWLDLGSWVEKIIQVNPITRVLISEGRQKLEKELKIRRQCYWLWRWRRGAVRQGVQAADSSWKRQGCGSSSGTSWRSPTRLTPWFYSRETHVGLVVIHYYSNRKLAFPISMPRSQHLAMFTVILHVRISLTGLLGIKAIY